MDRRTQPTPYTDQIRETLARIGRVGMVPIHVEAWMRVEHGTLDALSPAQFRAEVETAARCVDQATVEQNDALARSYGLHAHA